MDWGWGFRLGHVQVRLGFRRGLPLQLHFEFVMLNLLIDRRCLIGDELGTILLHRVAALVRRKRDIMGSGRVGIL